MGQYISQSDLETAHGVANVRKWSNLDNNTVTANTTNIAAAISWAEGKVNMRFRDSKYAVPIQPGADAAVLTGWCTALAGWKLYGARGYSETDKVGNDLLANFKLAMSEISDCLNGEASPDFAQTTASSDPTGPVVVF